MTLLEIRPVGGASERAIKAAISQRRKDITIRHVISKRDYLADFGALGLLEVQPGKIYFIHVSYAMCKLSV
jgi:hypothetical protein